MILAKKNIIIILVLFVFSSCNQMVYYNNTYSRMDIDRKIQDRIIKKKGYINQQYKMTKKRINRRLKKRREDFRKSRYKFEKIKLKGR